jgi:hypothetical protein
MNHAQLQWWSFVWSEVRLLIAAVALFIGGVPPALFLAINVPGMLPFVTLLLRLCWLVSGVAALYLLYGWASGGQKIFGRKDTWDLAAFAVLVVSGINLGIVGLTGQNIGLSLAPNYLVLVAAAVVYLVCAIYLYRSWSSHGQKVF